MKKKLCHFASLRIAQARLQSQTKHYVAKNIQPREQGRFLKHHQPVTSWMKYRLIIRHDLAFVRFFQAGDDVEQCRFSATARTNDDDKLAFSYLEGDIIERMHVLSLLLKPLRNVVDHQLSGRWAL